MMERHWFRWFAIGFTTITVLLFAVLAVSTLTTVSWAVWVPFTREIVVGFIVKLVLALLGILGVRLVLYYFDDLLGINFKEWFSGIPETSQALYIAVRFFAVALFFAIILA